MAILQQQARALGDPTRYEIFRSVGEADAPVGIRELSERFPQHPNAIRQHVARLVDAGLLRESTAAPTGRGRPRFVYTVAPEAVGRWGSIGPYEELSRMLATVISTDLEPREVGRRAAERLRVGPPTDDGVDDVVASMAGQGFDPVVERDGDRVDVVLRSCPFASAAADAPATVCALHLGIAEGLVDGTDRVVDELLAEDPAWAGCRLRLAARTEPDGAAEGALTLGGRS